MDKKIYEYVSKITNDPVIERKNCVISGEEFPIYKSDIEFYDKIAPTFNGKKYILPLPSISPKERMRRRLMFLNIHNLYNSKRNNKNIISPFSQDKELNIVPFNERKTYATDKSNINYDFAKSFFEQFKVLQIQAPRRDRVTYQSENCDWAINTALSKNCYLVRSCEGAEDCYYGERIVNSSYIVDSILVDDSQYCYQLIDAEHCYKVFWGEKLKYCRESILMFDCEKCESCFCCVGLKDKKNYIFNKLSTKQEIDKVKKQFLSDEEFRTKVFDRFYTLKSQHPIVSYNIIGSENSIGNEIFNSKNILFGYFMKTSENCIYADLGSLIENCRDVSQPDRWERCYQCASSYHIYNCLFCFNSVNLKNCIYCETCSDLENCFGCVGLTQAQYCIFNKQYTKEEYEKTVANIIENMQKKGEWGLFFQGYNTMYDYNESIAYNYMPLTMEECQKRGLSWRQEEIKNGIGSDGTILTNQLQEILKKKGYQYFVNKLILCEKTKKPFKFTLAELKFYEKMGLPLPDSHFSFRHMHRLQKLPERELHLRSCDRCQKETISVWEQNSKHKIYCPDCYNKELY